MNEGSKQEKQSVGRIAWHGIGLHGRIIKAGSKMPHAGLVHMGFLRGGGPSPMDNYNKEGRWKRGPLLPSPSRPVISFVGPRSILSRTGQEKRCSLLGARLASNTYVNSSMVVGAGLYRRVEAHARHTHDGNKNKRDYRYASHQRPVLLCVVQGKEA